MKLSKAELSEYVRLHNITKKDISTMAVWLPTQTTLELCLELIDCGYKIEDIRAMIDSSNNKGIKIKLTPDVIQGYAASYPITASNVIRLAQYLPRIRVLKLCLDLVAKGYHVEDLITIAKSAYGRKEKGIMRDRDIE